MNKRQPIPVFMLSYERPLYLWSSLDSLYRGTRYPCHFILADNSSRDPHVREVLDGFDRRGMFHTLHHCDDNRPDRFAWLYETHRDLIGEYWAVCETDVAVAATSPCWLERMVAHMEANPKLGMLGSYVDTTDFISLETARQLEPGMAEEDLAPLIKLGSPERGIDAIEPAPVISPFNPPGRLVLIRTEPIETTGIDRDSQMHKAMLAAGWETGIATDVIHRHLSLLNLYDYAGYDMKMRDDYFNNPDRRQLGKGRGAARTESGAAVDGAVQQTGEGAGERAGERAGGSEACRGGTGEGNGA